jgi:hypothetical protein
MKFYLVMTKIEDSTEKRLNIIRKDNLTPKSGKNLYSGGKKLHCC